MFRNFGTGEIILILVVVLLLFGARRLPDTARGLGRALRIFKAETKGLRDDETDDDRPAPPPPREIASTPRDATESRPAPAKDTERTER
jgi:sec-independent protein translocase protein TatA